MLSKIQKSLLKISQTDYRPVNNLAVSFEVNGTYEEEQVVKKLKEGLQKYNNVQIGIDSSGRLKKYKDIDNIKKIKISDLEKVLNEKVYNLNNKASFKIFYCEVENTYKVIIICDHVFADIDQLIMLACDLKKNINNEEFYVTIESNSSTEKEELNFNNYFGEAINNCKLQYKAVDHKAMILPKEMLQKIKFITRKYNISAQTLFESALLLVKSKLTHCDSAAIGVCRGERTSRFGKGPQMAMYPMFYNFDQTISLEKFIQNYDERVNSIKYEGITDVLKKFNNVDINSLLDISFINLPVTGINIIPTHYQYSNYTIQFDSKKIIIDYPADSDDETTAVAIFNLLNLIFEQICSIPRKKISELELLDNDIRNKINSLSSGKVESKVTIQEIFDGIVKHYSENIAVTYKKQEVTYKVLNKKVNRLASYLKYLGVKHQDIIANANNGIELIVGILAAMKLGAIYLPISRKNPPEQNLLTIKELDVKYILSDHISFEGFKTIKSEDYKNFDYRDQELNQCDFEDLVYIIQTSGTTGKPKNVQIKNNSIVKLAANFSNYFEVKKYSNIQQFADKSFDAAMLEIYGSMLNGLNLVMIPDEIKEEPKNLVDYWNEKHVQVAIIPPVYMKFINPDKVKTLRVLINAGEAAEASEAKKWNQHLCYANAYGPSETTVWATTYIGEPKKNIVPIGKPNSGVKCKVLLDGKECGIGIVGELIIGGVGLFKGYYKDELKTNACMTRVEGETYYKTGDLVYWDINLNLIFIGRKDNQVKINGHRVELGHIESALLNIQQIEDACIIYAKKERKHVLAAFIVTNKKIVEIRKELSQKLATYFIPNKFIYLNKLPTNKNGKVDKRKLENLIPIGKSISRNSDELYRAIEQILEISISEREANKSFEELGGDSISAMELANLLSQKNIELTANQIIFASKISDLKNNGSKKSMEYPISNIQRFLFSQNLVDINHYNQSLVLKYKHIDSDKYMATIRAIVNKHPQLRAEFNPNLETYHYTEVNEGNYDLKAISDLKDDVDLIIDNYEEKLQKTLNIFKGIVFKTLLIQAGNYSYIIFVAHHLVIDGVSWRIIISEFENQIFKNKLISINNSGNDFALERNTYDESSITINDHKWNNILKAMPDKKQRNRLLEDIQIKETTFESKMSETILNISSTKAITVEEFLLANFVRVLLNKNKSTSLMLEEHGRNEENIALTRTVGWFTKFFPYVIEKSNDQITKAEIIRDIREKKEEENRDYLNYRQQKLSTLKEPEIIFNYFGKMDSLSKFGRVINFNSDKRISSANSEIFGLTVSVYNLNNKIKVNYKFDANYFEKDYIEEVAKLFYLEICNGISNDTTKVPAYSSKEGEAIRENHINLQNINNVAPLLPMQKNLLYLEKLETLKKDNLIQVAFNYSEKFDLKVVAKAINDLYNTIPALRNKVIFNNENALLVTVNDEVEIDISDEKINWVLVKDRNRGFSSLTKQLFRATVIPHARTVIFTFSHLILDGFSLKPLIKIFSDLLLNKSVLEDYSNKNVLQKDYSKLLKPNRSDGIYWNGLFNDFESNKLDIPLLKRYSERIHVDKYAEINISSVNINHIKEVLSKFEISFDSYLLTLWGLLLRGYNNSNDIAIGQIVSGRDLLPGQFKNSIGMFINNIPVRISNNLNTTLRQLLNSIDRQKRASNKHLSMSISEIEGISSDDIESYFSHEVIEKNFLDNTTIYEKHEGKLELTVTEINDLSRIRLNYNGSKYAPEVMQRMIQRYSDLLSRGIDEMEKLVTDISLITNVERKEILQIQSNRIKYCAMSVYEKFSNMAEKYPSQTAVVVAPQKVTYAELKNEVERLSIELRKRGVSENSKVIVCLNKSILSIVYLLAIAKIGAIYIPVDKAAPNERFEYIKKDSNTNFWITEKGITQNNNNDFNLELKNVAYIIYTSGTTGKPKGVAVPETGIINIAYQMSKIFNFNEQDVIQQFASLGFDASIIEIYSALLNGLTLVVIPEEIRLEPDKIVRMWNKYRVTMAILTPSMLKVLPMNMTTTLRHVKSVGEPIDWQLAKELAKKYDFVNGYGPTEATVWSTYWKFKNIESNNVPIGQAIENCKAIPVQHDQVVGIDMPGELYIGGVGLAQGYLNRPELTQKLFVNKKILSKVERFYKSGDIVRLIDSHTLEYLGRKDHQVKIRGNRVELGEIEAIVSSLKKVKYCHVVFSPDKKLNCFVVADKLSDTKEIEEYLVAKVPSYMIPNNIIIVEKLPRTTNGKVDDKSLLAKLVQEKNPSTEENNTIIQEIAAIVKGLLPNVLINVEDSFIELGGHSILAMKFANALKMKYDVTAAVSDILTSKSILDIARIVEGKVNSKKGFTDKNKVSPAASTFESAVIDPQKRIYTIQLLDEETTAYNLRALIKLDISSKLIKRRIKWLQHSKSIFQASFDLKGDEIVVSLDDKKAGIDFEERETADLEKETNLRPFNLKTDNLLRIKILKYKNHEFLHVESHHIISDGVTMANLFRYLVDGCKDIEFSFEAYRRVCDQYLIFEKSTPISEKEFQMEPVKAISSSAINKQTCFYEIEDNCFNDKKTKASQLFSKIFKWYFDVYEPNEIGINVPINTRENIGESDVNGMFTNSIPIVLRKKDFNTVQYLNNKFYQIFDNSFISLSNVISKIRQQGNTISNPFPILFSFNNMSTLLANGKVVKEASKNTVDYSLVIDLAEKEGRTQMRIDYDPNMYSEQEINMIQDYL